MKLHTQMRSRSQGFTLIEILIVVFIIGLTASVVAISIGDKKDDTGPKKEAATMRQAIDFAGEYAMLNGELIGMFVTFKDSDESIEKVWCYRWQRFIDGHWTDMPEDTLNNHCLSETVKWELVIEGKAYVYDPELEVQPPLLVFSPSGETVPAEIAFFETGSDQEARRIEIGMMGDVKGPEKEEELEDEKVTNNGH